MLDWPEADESIVADQDVTDVFNLVSATRLTSAMEVGERASAQRCFDPRDGTLHIFLPGAGFLARVIRTPLDPGGTVAIVQCLPS